MNFGPATKVHLLSGATDMRLGFEGLFALTKGLLEADPLSGHLFGFCNKARNRLKILYWDGSGLWILTKRLERGRYAWPQNAGAPERRAVLMTQAELTLLLHGIDLAATKRRRWHRVENGSLAA